MHNQLIKPGEENSNVHQHHKHLNSLIPQAGNPFFIVTPPYTGISAGITVLHILCHYLNRLGEAAYIVHYPPHEAPLRSLPGYVSLQDQPEFPAGFLAPLITQDALNYYADRKLNPIVIYPEVFDNPLRAKFFGRYILNYPGKLSDAYQEKANFGFAYSEVLAKYCTLKYPDHNAITDTLFIPTANLDFWNQSGASRERNGSCYYAGKLREIHNETPLHVPSNSIEILRSKAMTRLQIREIFWQSEVFYCYEDSALAVEAMLCGCPAVFVPNRFFDGQPLGRIEHGTAGWCVSDEPGGLERAKATVADFSETVRALMVDVPVKIATLAAYWKSLVAEQDYAGSISYPLQPRMVFFTHNPASAGRTWIDNATEPSPSHFAARAMVVFNRVSLPFRLINQTIRQSGFHGVFGRVALGLRRHGLLRFSLLLIGVQPNLSSSD